MTKNNIGNRVVWFAKGIVDFIKRDFYSPATSKMCIM